jgi:hypothetical protein
LHDKGTASITRLPAILAAAGAHFAVMGKLLRWQFSVAVCAFPFSLF